MVELVLVYPATVEISSLIFNEPICPLHREEGLEVVVLDLPHNATFYFQIQCHHLAHDDSSIALSTSNMLGHSCYTRTGRRRILGMQLVWNCA